jgi:type VI secretion system secreted protein VgrG
MIYLSQANRPLQVTTPLGDNALVVTGFRGREELSGLFSIELDLIAEKATRIDFSKLVGSELTSRSPLRVKAATPNGAT